MFYVYRFWEFFKNSKLEWIRNVEGIEVYEK